jgi:hypothetical protein
MIPKRDELPDKLDEVFPLDTIAVHVTYRYVVAWAEDPKTRERKPVYGGDMARYLAETGFELDRGGLRPDVNRG